MFGIGRMTAAGAFLVVALAGPVAAQSPDDSLAQDLTNCAGAVAAHAGLDVIAYPQGARGEWAQTLGAILDAMNREEGVQGMTGRYAANAARGFWAEQPPAEREAAASECRARFGSN